ncbi:hypothetical protein TIFTF001_052976 [Ficus carica]|uniref:Uncharacterized protein n=1 Tax=Ficus carica TaxID=3494 RepID=A0AA88EBC7_FICCA|nr:hypothetical protein TIFTF001_039705 [Ficus carica]GMN73127.1 hypothetical protein TIFTF001_052976 [Ficus carica]
MNWFRSATRRDEDAESTSDAQREDDDMCARAVVAIINSRRKIRRNPQPMHDSMLTGSRSDDVNEDYVLDEGIDDTGPSTGTDQHGSMNQLRERMADAMWERYQSYPWYRAT